MTADNPMLDLLAAPLSPDWTVEGLAEQLLSAIAAQSSEESRQFVLDEGATTNRQARRVLRPLLACLANKSAAEAGTPANLYGGCLSFKRSGPRGSVWIIGQFENRPGAIRVSFRRYTSSPQSSEPGTAHSPVIGSIGSSPHASQAAVSRHVDKLPSTRQPDRSALADKRRRAKAWVAEYAKAAPAWASVYAGMRGSIPQASPSPAVTMCYEIGRIYRDDWSYSDAEWLARTLSIPEKYASVGVGAAIGYFLSPVPFIGGMLALEQA